MADEMEREQPGREAEEQPEEGIPVKFNKQVRRLTTAEAAGLRPEGTQAGQPGTGAEQAAVCGGGLRPVAGAAGGGYLRGQ